MNQDQIRKLLLEIKPDVEPFSLIFSGKSSKRVDGLYKTDKREIIIHNKNMEDSNSLLYTAIHEFAHHIQFTDRSLTVSSRHHSKVFYSIFHNLLSKAEELGIYRNIFKTEAEFRELTEKLKESFMKENGELMKEFGRNLLKAFDLCKKHKTSFEDYVDRELNLGRSTAKSLIRIYTNDVDPAIGYDNMKFVASIPDSEKRTSAAEALKQGKSREQIKEELINKNSTHRKDPLAVLTAEKERIKKTINTLSQRLDEIERRITELEEKG